MFSNKEVAIVYEALLSSPGMNDNIRVDLKIARRSILMLVKIIEQGVAVDNAEKSPFISAFSDSTTDELSQTSKLMLEKAGLSEMYERMNSILTK